MESEIIEVCSSIEPHEEYSDAAFTNPATPQSLDFGEGDQGNPTVELENSVDESFDIRREPEVSQPRESTVPAENAVLRKSHILRFLSAKFKLECIMTDLLEALNYITDTRVRTQFEYLLDDFHHMIYNSEYRSSRSGHPHFYDYIKRWLRRPSKQEDVAIDKDTLKKINTHAMIKLQEAKDLQRQIADISRYFKSISKTKERHSPAKEHTKEPQATNSVSSDHHKTEVATKVSGQHSSENHSGEGTHCSRKDSVVKGRRTTLLASSHGEKKSRMKDVKKSTELLSQEIDELENSLESSVKYLSSLKSKKISRVSDTMQRELYTFQKSIIEKIVASIEILYGQLAPIAKQQTENFRNTVGEQTHPQKLRTKEKALNSLSNKTRLVQQSKPKASDDYQQLEEGFDRDLHLAMRAVIRGMEIFQTTCSEIWEETLRRISVETEMLLMSSKSSESWVQQGVTAAATETESVVETDLRSLSLTMLESVAVEFSRLMIISRLKELQLLSIDFMIGYAFLSLVRKPVSLKRKKTKTSKKSESTSCSLQTKSKEPVSPSHSSQTRAVSKTRLQSPAKFSYPRPPKKHIHGTNATNNNDQHSQHFKSSQHKVLAERSATNELLGVSTSRGKLSRVLPAAELQNSIESIVDLKSGALTKKTLRSRSSSIDHRSTPWIQRKKRYCPSNSESENSKCAVSRGRSPASKPPFYPSSKKVIIKNSAPQTPIGSVLTTKFRSQSCNGEAPSSSRAAVPGKSTGREQDRKKQPDVMKQQKPARRAKQQFRIVKTKHPKVQFMKTVADMKDYSSIDSVGNMDTTHKMIQYNSLMPVPTPPSVNRYYREKDEAMYGEF